MTIEITEGSEIVITDCESGNVEIEITGDEEILIEKNKIVIEIGVINGEEIIIDGFPDEDPKTYENPVECWTSTSGKCILIVDSKILRPRAKVIVGKLPLIYKTDFEITRMTDPETGKKFWLTAGIWKKYLNEPDVERAFQKEVLMNDN